MTLRKVRFGRVAALVNERDGDADFRIGLEAVEQRTGRLLLSRDTDYQGEGVGFRRGDVLFGKLRPYLAKVWRADRDGAAVGDFHVYRPVTGRVDPDYLKYCLLADSFISPVSSSVYGAKMPRASWDFIRNVELLVPSIDEQRAIADFLDRETAQIDTLIAKQQRLIATLRERRTAVVSAVVRRGTRSDVPTIDSGVTWLGEIPAHWEVKRLKYSVASVVPGVWGGEPMGDENDVRCVRVADFDRQALRVNAEAPTVRSVPAADRQLRGLRPGDLLLEKSGGTAINPVGVVVMYEGPAEQAVCANFIARIRTVDGQDPRYWLYAHSASYATRMTQRSVKQTTGIQNLDQTSYFDERFPFPPLQEQREIAAYLDAQTSRIDALIQKSERLIELSQERRAALITAAVTGQIDVRKAA